MIAVRRPTLAGDLAGAVADLGVMVPLATALILVNGLDAGAVFVAAGLLVLASGVYFGIPFPVQPLKALTAVAVAQRLGPGVINAAGLEIAVFLLALSIGGVANVISRVFTRPIVRALQVGVGILLVVTAGRLVSDPPEVFRTTPHPPWPFVLAVAAFAAVWWVARSGRYGVVIALLVTAVGIGWTVAMPDLSAPELTLPQVALPTLHDFASAFVLLVVPQLPLTFGNAVVAVTDVAHGAFGDRAQRVTPSTVCISCGLGNVISGLIGGAPMCHGAGGLTAHVRLGARTRAMNVVLGLTFVALGLFFANEMPVLLGSLPVWALAAFLAYAGLRHAGLVRDLRGGDLLVALGAGAAGAYLGNLALTVATGLAVEGVRRFVAAGRGQRERIPAP